MRNEISCDVMQSILRNIIEEKAIPTISQEKFIIQAFALAVNEKITIYNSLFITAAKELKTELLTSDRKQADVAARNSVRAVLIE